MASRRYDASPHVPASSAPRFLDRDLPEREHVLVGPLIQAAVVAVAEVFAQRDGIERANSREIDHRSLGRRASATPGKRVQGKFSIHEPCDATGSIACTLAHVSGAFHQL